MKHYPNCRSDYPEKPPGEKAQGIEIIDLEDGTEAHVCVDCGASEVKVK